MPTITVRFRGICCFIDKTNGEDFEKRVVLPGGSAHSAHADFEAHLPIIEFLADDLKKAPAYPERISYSRPGDDGQYQRIEIKDPVMIEFQGLSSKRKTITRGLNLEDSIIHLDDLAPNRKLALKSTLLGPALKVDPKLAVVVIDLPPGVLMAGPPEPIITSFPAPAKFEHRRTARWLEHIMEVDDDFSLKLTPLGGDRDAVPQFIHFAPTTRLITIANEPERMIVGHFVQSATGPKRPTGHFAMYWDLITDPPSPPIVPEPFQGSAIGCAPSNKP
jgi:hypothetical protein